MSVTRINQFQAAAGKGDALSALIDSFLPMIESAEGCRSCRLLRSMAEPDRIVVVEVWESVEAHEAATRAIPPETMQQAMSLLAGPPTGDYYS